MKKYFDFETILTSDSFDAELSMAVNNKSKAKITTDGTQVIEFQKKFFFLNIIDENILFKLVF